ncbi:alpha/beta hydrolase [Gimesia chilikensis]|uniref:alpha/beta hydrolase n=1 Tax=Gimesia chilikensis TaxID=2605989 RepID=UPI0011EE987D|nr:alpha/beta hydrolase [Gimesia chilikensis]KAA0141544.1 alpha/beta hydrolase [Gimesia chilikensis]
MRQVHSYFLQVILTFSLCSSLPAQRTNHENTSPAVGTRLTQTCEFDNQLAGEESLLVVPENRNQSDSRKITIHYFRFPARQPSGKAPVFYLPGGPGDAINSSDIRNGLRRKNYSKYRELLAFNAQHDVIIVNQRGNRKAPGIQGLPRAWVVQPGARLKPMVYQDEGKRVAEGLQLAIQECARLQFDLKGYDILHLIDDVEQIRRVHGYSTICLRGSSFGSQWALGYLQRYPERVDRMVLSGVEPLSHTYDNPTEIWKVFERIEAEVKESGTIELPPEGLLGALKAVLTRMEKQPVRVTGQHPRRGGSTEIVIGADDVRFYLTRPILDAPLYSRRMRELWPHLVLELYREDYQYLAAKIIDDRPEVNRPDLLLALIDHSLGISDQRLRELEQGPARRWLGDVNWLYTATRKSTPTPEVSDAFRELKTSQTPVLMIHGTLDLMTPYENATQLLPAFPRGKLITVQGGTHIACQHAVGVDPQFLGYLTDFMSAAKPADTLKEMPETITLPPLKIQPLQSGSLFQELTQ